jgi:hypothetical protein
VATKYLSPQLRLANEAIAQERQAGTIVTLVAVGLVLANVLLWAIVATGS